MLWICHSARLSVAKNYFRIYNCLWEKPAIRYSFLQNGAKSSWERLEKENGTGVIKDKLSFSLAIIIP